MTDREMLELAAKAADLRKSASGDGWHNSGRPGERWNPLEDDGDALRLAVKLGFLLHLLPAGRCIVQQRGVYLSEDVSPDPYAATRRAIVRAAAKIGGSMF